MADAAPKGVSISLGSGRTLSPMQRGLWASQLNHPESPLQNIPLLSHLKGSIDPRRLALSFLTVVRYSDVLRTRLTQNESGSGTWDVELIKPADLRPTEIVEVAAADVERWARQRGQTPLDMLDCGYDSAIAVHEDGSLSWYLKLHHVITDATSSALVFEARAEHYNSSAISSDAGSYYSWARGLRIALDSAVDKSTQRSVAYWRDRPAAPKIGRLYTAVDTPTPEATRYPLPMGPEVLRLANEGLDDRYRMLTKDLGWSALLITAAALYCHRVGGAEKFSIGMPVHNRSKPEARQLIGPTMEVFPVDIVIEHDDTFGSLHRRVSKSILHTLRHASPGTAPPPDFEAVVNVIPRAEQTLFGSTPVSTSWLHSGAIDPNHLMRVQMTGYSAPGDSTSELDGELAIENEFAIDVNHGAARPEHRDRAAGHFMAILSEMVTNPDASIGGASICGPDELDRLAEWEFGRDFEGPTELLTDRLFHALSGNHDKVIGYAQSSSSGPGTGGEERLSGDELWNWIAATAQQLIEQGVKPGDRVGVELPRCVEAVVAIMAIMAAGGSFVPLDPAQPAGRRRRLAEQAGCVLVLSSVTTISTTRPDTPADFVPVPRDAQDEAYLLFTSGSTGEPKGVPITHDGLARYIRFAEQSYGSVPPIAPLFSALTFDLTITSLFMPILAGGTLLVVREDGPKGLATIAATKEINWCKATPSHLEILVRLLPEDHSLCLLYTSPSPRDRG